MQIHYLLSNSTTAESSPSGNVLDCTKIDAKEIKIQARGTTTAGAGASTVVIEVGNENGTWLTAGTITLTLATSSSNDGFAMTPWPFIRARQSAISGTGASVTVTAGY